MRRTLHGTTPEGLAPRTGRSRPIACLALAGTGTRCGDGASVYDGGLAVARASRPFESVGIVGDGQSLSIGGYGAPILAMTQPFHNVRFGDSGPAPRYPLDGGGVLSLVPATEPIRGPLAGCPDYQYPNNTWNAGESPDAPMANPPMAWEESIAPSHRTANTQSALGRGFEAYDPGGRLQIDSVAGAGDDVPSTPHAQGRARARRRGARTGAHTPAVVPDCP